MYVTHPHPSRSSEFNRIKPSARSGSLPETRVQPGTHLYREGDRVTRVYQVNSGAVRLTRLLEDGRRQIIAFGFPGDVVGFPAAGRHHTDCEALTDVVLQPFPLASLEDGTADPLVHRRLLEATLREIAAMQDHFMMLGRKSAGEKVASFLSALADRIGTEDENGDTRFRLPMSRADIADFLGLTTETVSRTFSQLRRNGIIALDGVQTVVLLDADALSAMAEASD